MTRRDSKGRILPDKKDPCAWTETVGGIETPCGKRSTGKSKYCAFHRAEAKRRWVSMIRAKQVERSEAMTPRDTGEGTFYPASYFRYQSKVMILSSQLVNAEWGVIVSEGRACLMVKGQVEGKEVTLTEPLE
jgi:hypothetical protein